MVDPSSGEQYSPPCTTTAKRPRSRSARSAPRAALTALVLTAAMLAASAASALADGTVTLGGGPLIVSVGSLGECQSSYPNVGVNFYPPGGTLGDCGFFLAFPVAGNPKALQGEEGKGGTVFGFTGSAGPSIPFDGKGGISYTPVGEQGPVTGSGTSASPYSEITQFKVSNEGKDFALVTVTTTYINGEVQFTSSYKVQNITSAPEVPLFFHAIEAGDLYVSNDDHGTGVFLGGPPRFIGGQNAHTGTLGGFIEVPTSPWSNYQEGYWNGPNPLETVIPQDEGIWNAVRTSAANPSTFNNTIDPNLIDNGAGVSWDQYLKEGLAAKATAEFKIINRAQVPTTLGVQPVTQSLSVGQTGTITVTATDNVGTPYAGRSLVYSIGGANPKSGSVITNANGVATISYVGTNAGLDTIQMFLDLAGTGHQAPQDPASTAQITWAPPNSTYKVQSIHANSNGTITITFVPVQGGTAVIEVTVPTATIARRVKCRHGQSRIKGKCRPTNTVSGRVTATGVAGVPLKLTVNPSGRVRSALKKGKSVALTVKLTYKSALGGAPTVTIYHVTVKGKRKHH